MTTVKKIQFNLDLPAEERWKEIIPLYKKEVLKILALIDEFSSQIPIIGSFTKETLLWLIRRRVANQTILFLGELTSIAEMLEVPVERVILMQLCYECFSACTTIAMKLGDEPVHFRTMDWGISDMQLVTIELEFIRKGKPLFTAVTWAGAVGIFTAVQPKGYSVALNYRSTSGNIFRNLIRAMKNCWPAGFLIRKVFEEDLSFRQAEMYLSKSHLISPCYISLLSADGEARVLIRDRNETIITRKREITIPYSYLIQTNIDPGASNPNILWSVERTALAEKLLKKEYQTPEQLLKSFLRFPILNYETIHASILYPRTGKVITVIPEEDAPFSINSEIMLEKSS